MILNLIPIGYHRSYTFTIGVKTAILQDLKLERKRIGLIQISIKFYPIFYNFQTIFSHNRFWMKLNSSYIIIYMSE